MWWNALLTDQMPSIQQHLYSLTQPVSSIASHWPRAWLVFYDILAFWNKIRSHEKGTHPASFCSTYLLSIRSNPKVDISERSSTNPLGNAVFLYRGSASAKARKVSHGKRCHTASRSTRPVRKYRHDRSILRTRPFNPSFSTTPPWLFRMIIGRCSRYGYAWFSYSHWY